MLLAPGDRAAEAQRRPRYVGDDPVAMQRLAAAGGVLDGLAGFAGRELLHDVVPRPAAGGS
jgi:hypothetical protein